LKQIAYIQSAFQSYRPESFTMKTCKLFLLLFFFQFSATSEAQVEDIISSMIDTMSWDCLSGIVDIYHKKGKYVSSMPYIRRLNILSGKRFNKKSTAYYHFLSKVLLSSKKVNDLILTRKIYSELVFFTKERYGKNSIHYLTEVINLAFAESKLGNFTESEKLCWMAKNTLVVNPVDNKKYTLELTSKSFRLLMKNYQINDFIIEYVDASVTLLKCYSVLSYNYKGMGLEIAQNMSNESLLVELIHLLDYLNTVGGDVPHIFAKEIKDILLIFNDYQKFQTVEKKYYELLESSKESEFYSILQSNLAEVFVQIGEYNGAATIYFDNLIRAEKKWSERSVPYISILEKLAFIFIKTGNISEARLYYINARSKALEYFGRSSDIYNSIDEGLKNIDEFSSD
jgi:tetratricopeptide (TPR) repeat protein